MHLRIAAVCIALCAGAACGGGVPDIVDDTPPTLDASQPADGESQVLVGTSIRLTFSELVRHEVAVSVQVDDAAPVTIEPQYSDSGQKTTLTIAQPALDVLPSTVTLTLTNVKDVSENTMPAPPVLRWTYPDWLPMGVQLTTSANNLLAAGANGPVTAWLESGAVKVRAWNGTRWDAPADPIASGATSLSLITDAAGAPVVAYCDGSRFQARAYGGMGWTDVATGLPALLASSVGTGLTVHGGALHVAVASLTLGGGWMRLYRQQGTAWSLRSGNYDITSGQSITGIASAGAGVVMALASTPMPWLPDATGSWSNLDNPGGSVTGVGALGGDPLAVVGGEVKRWNFVAQAWMNLGTTANVVSLDTRGAAPVIVERSGTGGGAIGRVREWDAGSSSWVTLGAISPGTLAAGLVATEDAQGTVYRSANGVVSRYNRPPAP